MRLDPPSHLGHVGRWSSAICTMTPPLVPSSLFSLTNILITESWSPRLYTGQTKLINKATKSFVYWTGKPQSCSPFWLPSMSNLWITVWVWKPKASKKNVSITVSSLGQTRKSGWRGVEKNFLSQLPSPHKVYLQGEALWEDMLWRSEAQNSTDGLSLIAHTNVSVIVP